MTHFWNDPTNRLFCYFLYLCQRPAQETVRNDLTKSCNKHTESLGSFSFGKYKNNLRIYRLVKAETQALDVKRPIASFIFQIYRTQHFSMQVASIGYQILQIKMNNSTATLLFTLALSEASSPALWFLDPTELLQSTPGMNRVNTLDFEALLRLLFGILHCQAI